MRLLTILLITTCLATGGCGIKPSFVDPPQGSTQDTFPRTYPAE